MLLFAYTTIRKNYFTCEITKLPWQPSAHLSAKMVAKFFLKNVMNEDVRALKDTLENLNTQIAHQEGFYQEIC